MDFCYVILTKIFNLSITGSIAVLAVLALRFLLCKAPKQFSYILWGIVLFRLVCCSREYTCRQVLENRSSIILFSMNNTIFLERIICSGQRRLLHYASIGLILLVWLAFVLSGKDMEMSCDEAVMKKVKRDIRSEYASSLLSLAAGRRRITGAPLTFGESDTKSRIINVMNYKKTGVVILAAAVIVVAVGTVCLVTNPVTADSAKNTLFSGGESQNIISGLPKNVLENHYQQITLEMENAVKEIIAYGDPDAELIIENLLDEICSGMPQAVSNPHDYIAAHSWEYQQLISYRSFTVSYCVSRFEAGMETGLEGHIMARVLEELLKTKGKLSADAGETANGQEWYDSLKTTAPDILAKFCGLEEEPAAMELGIPVSLPENSSWIQDRVVKQSDERHFEIQYYDSVLEGQCTLWAVKDEEVHLPELGEQDWEEETWVGSNRYGKNVYVDVKYNEKWVLAEWEYQNYRFAILGEVSAHQTDIISVPKVALGVIMELE